MQFAIRLISTAALIFSTGVSCSRLPKDQNGALDRIRSSGEIRVGLSQEEPFVKLSGGEPSGVEVEIIKRFAESLGAHPVWTRGGEERLVKALEHFELDVVAGGLTSSTPWATHVGITAPYRRDQVLAVAPGENELVKRLDEFTHAHRTEIEDLFAQEGTPK